MPLAKAKNLKQISPLGRFCLYHWQEKMITITFIELSYFLPPSFLSPFIHLLSLSLSLSTYLSIYLLSSTEEGDMRCMMFLYCIIFTFKRIESSKEIWIYITKTKHHITNAELVLQRKCSRSLEKKNPFRVMITEDFIKVKVWIGLWKRVGGLANGENARSQENAE